MTTLAAFPQPVQPQTSLCDVRGVADALAVAVYGCDLDALEADVRRELELDALAAIRRVDVNARHVAIQQAAEASYLDEMTWRNLSHLADWQNAPGAQRRRHLNLAAMIVAVVHESLAGTLAPQKGGRS